MSQRHRNPADAERAPKRERRQKTHRERQALRSSLAAAPDPEEILAPEFTHHGPRTASTTAPRRPRHWKLKAWKRRTAERRAKALMMKQLAKTP